MSAGTDPNHRATAELTPPTESKRRAMQAQRERDTKPELALRRELHGRGLRFRVHRRVLTGVRRELDIVFGPARVAVEVRGCFWHACPAHVTYPKANAEWWAAKLQRNVQRDRDTETKLEAAGWDLVVVWEHDDVTEASDQIEALVRGRR